MNNIQSFRPSPICFHQSILHIIHTNLVLWLHIINQSLANGHPFFCGFWLIIIDLLLHVPAIFLDELHLYKQVGSLHGLSVSRQFHRSWIDFFGKVLSYSFQSSEQGAFPLSKMIIMFFFLHSSW